MKQNKGKALLVIFVVAWAIWEMYPPWDRSLIETFNRSASQTDERFQEVVETARKYKQQAPEGEEFTQLLTAIDKVGAPTITNYFPSLMRRLDLEPGQNPTRQVLYELQKKSSGEINLGLDLQGGVSFLVGVDTNKVSGAVRGRQVLAQAISVLRKRVDSFGVTQPKIQQAGENNILIQMPGLSQVEKQSVKTNITRAAHLEFRLVHTNSSSFVSQGIEPPGYERLTMMQQENGNQGPSDLIVGDSPVYAYDIRLMSVDDVGEIPGQGNREVIVASVQGQDLHFRVFNRSGQQAIDRSTAALGKQSEDKKAALDRLAPRIGKWIAEGSLSRQQEENLRGQLADLLDFRPIEGLTGQFLSEAGVQTDPTTGTHHITLRFGGEGKHIFREVTSAHQGERLAIVLDGRLYSAPSLTQVISDGRAQITGDFTRREASNLANILTNPLEAPVEILQERSIDPTLGEDSIRSGIRACLIGLIAVSIFMLFYYFLAGLVANVALFLNLILLMGVLANLEATLTLPGIAGIVLTVGMAVDANVLIFERIREELNAGKSIRGAVTNGYDKAFSTIIDANITTLIASIILINLGTGPVKGFGVTLTIGIIASMFTALVVTRIIFDWFLERGWLKTVKMQRWVGNTKIDFMRWWKPAFVVSWILILIGIGYGVFSRGSDLFGVDFAGGDTVTMSFEQAEKVSTGDLRTALMNANDPALADNIIQYQTDLSDGTETLRVTTPFGKGEDAVEVIQSQFPQAGFEVLLTEQVGPSVGREIQRSAIVATLLALFGILVYVAFRFEYSFAVGAVIAVLHDILMTIGIFALSGGEFSAPMVAAILTIIGFSINDTIVIFDRIREDLQLGVRGSFKEVLNGAINRTLARTIITSGTTLLSTLALYIFGGVVIHDFAFTFLIGILVGTYSSIYTASALVFWWHKGQRPMPSTQITGQEAAAGSTATATA